MTRTRTDLYRIFLRAVARQSRRSLAGERRLADQASGLRRAIYRRLLAA